MTRFIFACVLMLLCAFAQAQVRKCIGPDGQVTYSDVVCGGKALRESTVNTDANTIDTSGLRREGQRIQAEEENVQLNDRISAAMKNPPADCKFSYYSLGDNKGKILAAKAKEECVRNMEARKAGREVSTQDYSLWKDHHQMMATKRSSARRTTNCMPNGFGGLRCN